MSVKSTKITVWINSAPGGITWDLDRDGMSQICAKPEGPFSTRAILIIPKPKAAKKIT